MELIRTLVNERRSSMQSATSDLRLYTSSLPNGKKQLIIGRGQQDLTANRKKSKHTPLNVFVPAHIDVYPYDKETQLKLSYDSKNKNKVYGRGVYDMHAGVLNGIALATSVKPPKGMNVFYAFTYDEEEKSEGAKAIINSWEWWKYIDIVLSSEIGHIEVPDDDDRMRYILGRRGRQKYHVQVDVDEQAYGHFAEGHVRSASEALVEGSGLIRDSFNHGSEISKKLMKQHSLLGDEKAEWGTVMGRASNLPKSAPPRSAEFYYNILSVPDRTLEGSLAEQQGLLQNIARHAEWAKHHITAALTHNPEETSYEPYIMGADHPAQKIAAGILTRISGGAVPAYAPSVADENLYAAALHNKEHGRHPYAEHKAIITIPPRGDGAHRLNEHVYLSSIASTKHALRMLIQDPQGLQQLTRFKRG